MIAQLDPLYIKTRPHKAIVRLASHLLFQGRFLTTKHRWLNKVILAELAFLKRMPLLKSVEKPIFIIGTGRSGSTILGKVLSMHRVIGFLNEPKAIWYSVCPQEDVNGHFGRGSARYRLNEQDLNPRIYKAAHRLFGNYLAFTASSRVLDKNPEIVFRIPFVRAIFPDAKFVFLVRNGWDTVASIAKWSKNYGKRTNRGIEDWWGINQRKWRLMLEQLVPTEPLLSQAYEEIKSLTRCEDMAAVEWVVTMQEGLRSLNSTSNCVHMVRFEDLTRDPEDTLKELLAFCELPKDTVFLSYAQQVLEPISPREPMDLSWVIRPPFLETLRNLDYTTS